MYRLLRKPASLGKYSTCDTALSLDGKAPTGQSVGQHV
jgi:hypothetical protein